MIILSLYRFSIYHQHISSNFFFLFFLVLIARLLFSAIVCSPESIINYTARETVDKCFSEKNDEKIKLLYIENYDKLWLNFLVVGIVFSFLKSQFDQRKSEHMTLKVYYYLLKCILCLVFVGAFFNYKLELEFVGLGWNWLIGNPFTPYPLFQRKFECDLKRNVPEVQNQSGQTTCRLRLNDLYEFIYIWVWIIFVFLIVVTLICLFQVITLSLFKKYRILRLKQLLPTTSDASIERLAENVDYFFVIECNSNKKPDKLRLLKNSLLNEGLKPAKDVECAPDDKDSEEKVGLKKGGSIVQLQPIEV